MSTTVGEKTTSYDPCEDTSSNTEERLSRLEMVDDNYHRLETKPKKSLSLLRQLSFKHINSQNTTDAEDMPRSNRRDIESNGSRKGQAERWDDNPTSSKAKKEKSRSSRQGRREQLLKDYEPALNDYEDIEHMVEDEVYIVKQKKGHLSIYFSMIQTVVLTAMMIQCSIAPLELNPMIGPPPDALDYWGGKNALKILDDNEEWRLITPIFLHAGIIHLLCNVSVQLDVGEFFEREWGSAIWLYIYLVSAVGSSLCSVCMMPDNISVGSSGAVMGLFGGKVSGKNKKMKLQVVHT